MYGIHCERINDACPVNTDDDTQRVFLVKDNYKHYSDVIMGTMASQNTSLTIVYSIVHSGADKK